MTGPATNNTYKQRGFTIVELLIVIVVIGILAAIVIVAYTGVSRNAKDASRMAKAKEISKAIERYYVDNGRYPAIQDARGGETAPPACNSTADNWGHCNRNKQLTDALEPYMKIDPTSLSALAPDAVGDNYYYTSSPLVEAGKTGGGNQMYGFMIYLEGTGGQNDGGFHSNAYELGNAVGYCMKKYTSTQRNWQWSSTSAGICEGGN